jgi:hypothetical protein
MKSKGLGDTIEKITTATGIKKVVEKVTAATGRECGCNKRKQDLNNPDLLINKTFYKNNNN